MRVGELVAQRFAVERRAGRGGMGDVFAARDRTTGALVALKILHTDEPALLERFDREARLLASFEDDTIVRYVDHGITADGEPYLAMEWLDGQDLATVLQSSELSLDESLQLARRAAHALALLHRRGVVHRDVKPANLFLVGGHAGAMKLLDFGVAHLRDASRAMTSAGDRIGTPRFMAPEQVRGDRALDGRADLFALGCVLYRCVTGRYAFDAESEVAVLARILLDDPPPASTVRPGVEPLDALLAGLLAKPLEGRLADGAALLAALDAIALPAALAPLTPAAPPTMILHRRALAAEKRAVSVVLVHGVEQELDEVARRFGLELERVAARTAVLTPRHGGIVRDLAIRSARAALAIASEFPAAVVSVATGLTNDSDASPLGAVVDRAIAQATDAPSGAVLVDAVTESLLDARFELAGEASRRVLRTLHDHDAGQRTLLGRPSPYVGREREQAALAALVAESHDEQVARVALVVGAAGLGKSRLRHELGRQLVEARPELRVWNGRGDVLRAASPYGVWAVILRQLAAIASGESAAQQAERLATTIAGLCPDREVARRVAPFLGEIAGVDLDRDQRLVAARRDPVILADLVRTAFVDFLAQVTESQPLLVLLDDLQWSDAPSIRLLDAALLALEDRPLAVVAFARPELHDLFPRLFVERAVQEVRLTELGKRACERLARGVLGPSLSTTAVERIVALADGNAFFLEELVRTVAETGGAVALPESVLAMVEARLARLSTDERRFLRAASVFGESFWTGGVAAVLEEGRGAESLGPIVRALRERELIAPRSPPRFLAEEELVFRHALLREGAYATLAAEDRARAHRLAVGWLRERGEHDAPLLGRHWELAGDHAAAATQYLAAASQSAEANDLPGARSLARHALSLAPSHDERCRLHLLLTEIASWLGEWALAAASAQTTLDEAAHEPQLVSRIFVEVAPMHVLASAQIGHEERALEVARELLARVAANGTAPTCEEAVALARTAAPLILRGHVALAEQLIAGYQDRLDELAPAGSREQAFLVDAIALHALFVGDLPSVRRWKQLEVDCFRKLGQVRHEALQRVWLGYACLESGDFAAAIRELEEVLGIGERMALGRVVALAKHNLGAAIARQPVLGAHELERAEQLERESIALFDEQHDVRLSSAARTYLAEILLRAEQLEEAARVAEEAYQLAPAGAPALASAAATWARVLLVRGEASAALPLAEEAAALLLQLGGTDEGEGTIRCVAAEALFAVGRIDEGRARLRDSLAALDQRAARFVEPDARQRFLSIPAHARTLALAALHLPGVADLR